MSTSSLNAQSIMEYHQDMGFENESFANLKWITDRIHDMALTTRALSDDDLRKLNTQITQIPTGKHPHLKRARDQVLMYLKEICEWTLPTKQEIRLQDHSLLWMVDILKHSFQASELLQHYQIQREKFMTERWSDLGWMLLALNIEVAPLPLRYWAQVLSTPSSIEPFEGQFTLKVVHPQAIANYASNEILSFTRYALPVFAYRLLQDFYHHTEHRVLTQQTLVQALNQWCHQQPYYFSSLPSAHWLRMFQSIWHYHYSVPAPLLRDLSDPMRHVATLTATVLLPDAEKRLTNLYHPPLCTRSSSSHSDQCRAQAKNWPHKALIKQLSTLSRAKEPAPFIPFDEPQWQSENILPKLFYHYAHELYVEGGKIRQTLLPQSIDRYTNFYKNLSPLSFDEACDPESLHRWASQQFEQLDAKTTPWHFYNFLCHVAQQDLTDHLDLSLFVKPTLPSQVDPFRLGVSEVHQVIETLLNTHKGNPIQRLFSSVAAALAYYGSLRRGEVLRLRVRDISVCPKNPQRFNIFVTRTAEGRPKNGKSRPVTACLPEAEAKLIRELLNIKERCARDSPLIGFDGETLDSRAQLYLYPVTQVLKALFGKNVRFHHLRHSGAELLYLQGLHLVYGRSEHHLSNILQDPANQAMLTPDMCAARFYFWLEGYPIHERNDSLLLDKIGSQLGHSHYATTRRHYIHGMEKVLRILKPKKQHYTRAELRYLLGMPNHSNDITRVLNDSMADYAQLSAQAKKDYPLVFEESVILPRIIHQYHRHSQSSEQNRGATVSLNRQKHTMWDDESLISIWTSTIPANHVSSDDGTFQLFNRLTLPIENGKTFDFTLLSQQWNQLHNRQPLTFSRTEQTALKQLGIPQISVTTDAENPFSAKPDTLIFTFSFRCNKKNQHAFHVLFHQGPFKAHPGHLILKQNRKTLKSDVFSTVTSEFKRTIDCVEKHVISSGNTELILQLYTHVPVEGLLMPLNQYLQKLSTLN